MQSWHKLVAVILIVIAVIYTGSNLATQGTVRGVVVDKAVKVQSAGRTTDSKYLVFVETDGGDTVTLEVTDGLAVGRFDSSDVYGDIKRGETYTFKTVGMRIPIISQYPNVKTVSK